MEDTNISNVIQALKKFIEGQQWEEAYKLLVENQKSFDEGIYHYNVGFIKANMNDLAHARYHLEMSKLKGFSSPELSSALKSVKEQLNIEYLESGNSLYDLFYRICFDIPADFYLFFGLLLILLILINLNKIKSILNKVLLLLIATTPALFLVFFVESKTVAITTSDILVLKGPSRIFDQVDELPLGAKIIINGSYNGWKKIVYPEKVKGWFFSEKFKALQD